jgi:hypothetical protein
VAQQVDPALEVLQTERGTCHTREQLMKQLLSTREARTQQLMANSQASACNRTEVVLDPMWQEDNQADKEEMHLTRAEDDIC